MAGYRDLKVWQLGVELAIEIYRLTGSFPKNEQYGLTRQLRRAAVSIASNIAEGHARKSQVELRRYLNIAKGSLAELETQLIIAKELGFSSAADIETVMSMAEKESRMISGLMRSIESTKS
jgi:four helix bundle protein